MSSPDDSLVPGRTARWKWLVCILLLLATMVNYMDRLVLNQLSTTILDVFQINKRDYGWLEAAFGSAFALGAIIFGWVADRWNVRWVYAFAVLGWSLSGFATGLVPSTSFALLLACRFSLGLFEAGNWPCALRTTQTILPPRQRTMGNSILQSGAAVGALLTPMIVMGLHRLTGKWNHPFLAIGAFGSAWVLLWLLAVRTSDLALSQRVNSPSLMNIVVLLMGLLAIDFFVHWMAKQDGWLAEGTRAWLPLTAKAAITLIGIGIVWQWLQRVTAGDPETERKVFFRRAFVCAVVVCSINTTWHFLRAWLPLFLSEKHGYGSDDTGMFLMGYYLSTDLGSLCAGFATLRLARRGFSVHGSRMVVFALLAFVAMLCAVVPMLPTGHLLVGTLFVIGFASLGLFPPYYSFTQDLSKHHQGKVSGALGCINWLVMSLMQEAVGDTVQRTQSYGVVIPAAGAVPLLGLVALLLFWGTSTSPVAEPSRPDDAPLPEK